MTWAGGDTDGVYLCEWDAVHRKGGKREQGVMFTVAVMCTTQAAKESAACNAPLAHVHVKAVSLLLASPRMATRWMPAWR